LKPEDEYFDDENYELISFEMNFVNQEGDYLA
jgi:hypothetical protein